MDKNSEIKFVGQPIFKQIITLVQKIDIQSLIRAHNSAQYYKIFKTRTHIITMLFRILSRYDPMTETCEGLRVWGGKLNHLGLGKAHSKSTDFYSYRSYIYGNCYLFLVYFPLLSNF